MTNLYHAVDLFALCSLFSWCGLEDAPLYPSGTSPVYFACSCVLKLAFKHIIFFFPAGFFYGALNRNFLAITHILDLLIPHDIFTSNFRLISLSSFSLAAQPLSQAAPLPLLLEVLHVRYWSFAAPRMAFDALCVDIISCCSSRLPFPSAFFVPFPLFLAPWETFFKPVFNERDLLCNTIDDLRCFVKEHS